MDKSNIFENDVKTGRFDYTNKAPYCSGKALSLLTACMGHVIWGFSYLFTKVALKVTSPDILLSIRFIIAFILMNLLIMLGKGKISFKGKPLKPLIILAVTEPLYFYFESYAIFYTNATFAGIVLAVVPVISILLAILFLKEYPTKRQVAFCSLPVAGVIFITISGNSLGIIHPLGVVLLLCTCITSAVYKIINRKSAEEYSSFERTYIILLASSIVFTAVALKSVNGNFYTYFEPLFAPVFLLSVLMLSTFCSVTANMLINYAAGIMPIVKFSTFGALTTLCSLLAGVIFLREPVTVMSFLGSMLIIVGIWQVTKG